MFLVSRVDLIAPLPRPLIQILPTAEGAPRQKVILDEMEGALHASRTVGIANGVRHELKAETLAKSSHLRHWHHVASAAAQHHHVRVIDHDVPRRAGEVPQRLSEKHLAVETPEGGVALEEQHARVAQHRRRGVHLAFPAVQFELMRRRVVLHLLARRKIILARRCRRRVSDSMPPAERGQRGVRHLRARPHQILMDSHEIPLTLVEKLQDLLPVGLRLLGAMQFRQGRRVGSQNFAACQNNTGEFSPKRWPVEKWWWLPTPGHFPSWWVTVASSCPRPTRK